MINKIGIDPNWTWDDDFILSQAIKADNTVYISGQVALDENGNVVGQDDMKAQTQQVFKNIETILEKCKSSLADIVKITIFTTDMSRLAETHEVRAKLLSEPAPASTAVEVKALMLPQLLIEIEAVALIKD